MTSVLQGPKPHDFLHRGPFHGPSMRPNTPSKAHTHPPASAHLKLDTPAATAGMPQRKQSWESPWPPPESLLTSPLSVHMKSPPDSHNKLPAIQSAAASPVFAGPASPDGGQQHQIKLPPLQQAIPGYNNYPQSGRASNRSNSTTRFRQDSFPRPGASYPSPLNHGSPEAPATSPRDFAHHHHQSPFPHPSLPPPSSSASTPATYPTPPSGHHHFASSSAPRRPSQPPEREPPLSATSATFTSVTDPHTSPENVFSPDAGNTTATAMTTPSGSVSMPTPAGSVFGGGGPVEPAARTPALPPPTPASAASSPAAGALPAGGGPAYAVPTHRHSHPHAYHRPPSDAMMPSPPHPDTMMPSPPHPDAMVLSPPGSSQGSGSRHHAPGRHSYTRSRPGDGPGGGGFVGGALQLPHPEAAAMVVSPADGKNVQITPRGPYPPEQHVAAGRDGSADGLAGGAAGAEGAGGVTPTLFKCTFSGCRALPFNTQYLLKYVSSPSLLLTTVRLTPGRSSHATVHSLDRPHFCPVDGCPRATVGFKRKNEMKRHGLVHASPGYECPFCQDRAHRYPRPDNLQRHVRVHHSEVRAGDPRLREVLEKRVEIGRGGREDRAAHGFREEEAPVTKAHVMKEKKRFMIFLCRRERGLGRWVPGSTIAAIRAPLVPVLSLDDTLRWRDRLYGFHGSHASRLLYLLFLFFSLAASWEDCGGL